MYMSVPISKQIIYSPTTSYTSLYILPMILDTSQVSKKNFFCGIPHYYIIGLRSNFSGIISPQIISSFDMSQIVLCILRDRKESTVVDITLTYVSDT